MSIELLIYLAGIADGLKTALILIAIFLPIAALFFALALEEWTRVSTVLSIIAFIPLIVGVLIPPERTVYMMAGAHVGKELIQSETANKVKQLLEAKLDEEIGKLKDKK